MEGVEAQRVEGVEAPHVGDVEAPCVEGVEAQRVLKVLRHSVWRRCLDIACV